MAQLPYPPSCCDDRFHLRLSPLLWLVILYSMNPVLVLAVATFSNSGEIFRNAVAYAYNVPSIVSSLPGAMVLIARMNRTAGAWDSIRWIWRNGRTLLALGLLMQLGTVFTMHWKELVDLKAPMIASAALNVGLLAVLLDPRYNRDVFADFPTPLEAGKG